MLYEARAGDDFAAMTGENTFSFFKFTGEEDTLLTGAELIGGPGEREQGSFGRIDLLDYQRGAYGRCVSGLLRRTEGQLEVRPTQPFLLPDAYSTIGMSGYHQVSALESTAKGLLVETTAALAMFAIESKVPGFGEWFKNNVWNQVLTVMIDVSVGYTVGKLFEVDAPGTHKLYFDYGVVTPALLPGYDYYTTFAKYVMAWQ